MDLFGEGNVRQKTGYYKLDILVTSRVKYEISDTNFPTILERKGTHKPTV